MRRPITTWDHWWPSQQSSRGRILVLIRVPYPFPWIEPSGHDWQAVWSLPHHA